MSSPKKQSGFTLVELLLVLAIGAVIAITALQTQLRDFQLDAAEALAGNVVQITHAVRKYRVANPDETSLGSQGGIDWLKSDSCGGQISGQGYLPCNFPSRLKYGLGLVSHLGTARQARIQIAPVELSGQTRIDLSGTVAQAITQSLTYVGDEATTVVDHDITPSSPAFGGVLVGIALPAGPTDDWIATDNSNPPVEDISWNSNSLVDVDDVEADDVHAATDIEADRDVVAGRQVGSRRWTDTDDARYGVDGDGTTRLRDVRIDGDLTVGGQVSARDYYLRQLSEWASGATYRTTVVPNGGFVPTVRCRPGYRARPFTAPSNIATDALGRQWSSVQTWVRPVRGGYSARLKLRTQRGDVYPRQPWASVQVSVKCERR